MDHGRPNSRLEKTNCRFNGMARRCYNNSDCLATTHLLPYMEGDLLQLTLERLASSWTKFAFFLRLVYGERHLLRFRSLTVEEHFTRIYEENIWGDEESVSGSTSTFEASETIRETLPSMLKDLGTHSFLDIPCGDFNWMQHVELGVDQYIGADIVRSLVDHNQQKFGTQGREFILLDLLEDELPQVDMIFVRECFIHFSIADIWKALQNIKNSGATYLLTTTHPKLRRNININTGSWRPINLEKKPFNLPEPYRLLSEFPHWLGVMDKHMGLWRVADLDLPGGQVN